MENTSAITKDRTISFVDGNGRTITISAPAEGPPVVKQPPAVVKTVQDTNLTHKIVAKDGAIREVAVTLRDDSVQEIFERVPSVLTRFGSAMVLGILILVLTAMAFIRYPDTINTAAMIRKAAAPTEDFTQLKAMLDGVQINSESIYVPVPETPLNLGELQLPYQELLLAYESYQEDKNRPALVATLRALKALDAFFLVWNKSQGPAVFTAGTLFATLELPVAATAGLEPGQTVSLELAKYPPGRFGRLTGEIAKITPPAAADEPYEVIISLPDGLVTSNQVTISYEEGLLANAKIITNRRSLLRKVID